MQAIILTEAGKTFGLGHLSRCYALKEYLINAGFEVVIYNRGSFADSTAISYDWLNGVDKILSKKALVIVDSYYADFALCEYITKIAKVCVFFDDFNRMQYPSESIILNGALHAQRHYINVQNEMYVGIEYGLLRKEFRTKEPKTINKDISRVLITLGVNDEANNTQKVLEVIEKELSYATIDVVLGNKHKPLSYGFNTRVHSNLSPSVLKNLMLNCDIAISGGGITMIELQSTLTPTIALEIAPNQSYQLRAWQQEGLRVANNIYQIKSLLKTLKKFKDRRKLHNRLEKIEIGRKIPHFVNKLVKKYNT